jgi:hypothetical protein
VTGVDPCRPSAAKPCGFPFAVAAITAPEGLVEAIHEDDGGAHTRRIGRYSGRREKLLLGSAFGDRVSVRTPTLAFRHRTVLRGRVATDRNDRNRQSAWSADRLHPRDVARSFGVVAAVTFDVSARPSFDRIRPARSRRVGQALAQRRLRRVENLGGRNIDAVLRALQVERAVFVAWSYGGHGHDASPGATLYMGSEKSPRSTSPCRLAGLRTVTRPPGADTDRLLAGSRLRASA